MLFFFYNSNVCFPISGWFEVLPENGQPVEYFDTINAIVGLRPKQFLVRTSIVGYQLSVENGASTWVPWEIRPGETLTTGTVHMDHKKTKKKTLFKRLFSSGKGGNKKEQELKYLQCFDGENREIMVPLIMTGVFSPVGDQTNQNYDAVYTLHDLISAFNLPMKAQLIHTDAHGYEGVPTGVLLLERLCDKETVLVGKHPYVEGESETFEIPLNEEFHVVKERKRKSKKPSITNEDNSYNLTETLPNGHVDLPIRVKDPTKKSKGSTILDKLSVRSKSKKERASIKALADEGIFSSRLSKSGVSFDEFYNDTEPDYDNIKGKFEEAVHNTGAEESIKSKSEIDLENGYSVTMKRSANQDRDLPPIPNKSKSPNKKRSPENDYEELPVAPGPPDFYLSKGGDEIDGLDDGYMTPARFRELNESSSTGEFDVIVKRKPPTAPRDSVRYTRARKVRSEYSSPPSNYDADTENIQQYFDYALAEGNNMSPAENPYDRRRAQPNNQQQVLRSLSQEEGRRFSDDTAIDTRTLTGFAKLKSRSQKSLNFESNATVRSHNVRRMRAAQDVFNFSDSLRDLRQPFQNGSDGAVEPTYGRVVDNERIKSYVYGEQSPYGRLGGHHYVESEPAMRRYHRSSSNAALSDSYPKHGDDSAISMCSRGEYGLMMPDSEYSYSEYSEWQDDGWIPPDDISNLSVLEVSKSLRYIGMKDRVVIRFAREQIDGNMLSSLDVKLLREGFPELNSLDIKKVLDFVGGWRPKK
ncbi:uncharacterized protein LOC123524018 [Mercenaria mercenaria]|uniref:uncharacterized protein LOC123524018 n=1 Tax=Mercenaria mercenaria TaxID=6596 RepID=UPI00234E4A4F|nr:uncharacterized protein LOC123524018 [Mercenaria mercenaria]